MGRQGVLTIDNFPPQVRQTLLQMPFAWIEHLVFNFPLSHAIT
jgi:hypothetical protein